MRHFRIAASEALPRCPAGRSPSPGGWVGGVYPSTLIPARTAASDGHCAFSRAARSAGLWFAVILLSKTMDRKITLREGERVCRSPHPPRSGPPSPQGEGQERALNWSETANVGRDTFKLRRAKRCRVARRGGALRRAGRLEGFTPPHLYRRGQRLPTDIRPPPAPREAHRSGLR